MAPEAVDEQTCKQIEVFVIKELLSGDGRGLTRQSDLVRMGLIDSVSTLTLTVYLEESFGVSVPTNDLTADNLRSVETIARLVRRLKSS